MTLLAGTRARIRRAEHAAAAVDLPGVVFASGLALAVLVLGPRLAGQPPTHRFLVWNLFLAWVPYLAALVVVRFRRDRAVAVAAGVVWLLFLPNAPYLVSDLVHLDRHSATPWLDLARLVAFAWAGCQLGVSSLRLVHRVVRDARSELAGWLVVLGAVGLSGPGVALGRFARFDSWSVVEQPAEVLRALAAIGRDRGALAISAFFSLLLLAVYVGFGGPAGRPSR